ncbi:TonB-dependent receptor domain-containing protein [Sphingomonas sp. MMS24-J13]|uniref:TonB-dependent receptor domain-containing protein n=1 Tax=Sphingomonas sp. MMS24-J13 TaxID=3238686 RepID=UPI00384D4D73
MSTISNNRSLLRTTALASITSALLGIGTPVLAQNAPAAAAEPAGQEIVVTGSRIARRDFEANSPIVTANQALLKELSTAALETNLNKLPQFTPVQTPNLGGDVQPTATNTPGAATVSLRNLGTNRNLVLLDGRRATPANALQVVDINTLPSVAIDRVEIITGGASATYGADAVAGVVNFILKKNFTGLNLDGQVGISQRGDNLEYRLSGIMGTNFADNRGNVSLALEMNDRHSAKRIDRPWFRDAFKNPTIDGTDFFPFAPGYQPIGTNVPNQAAVNSIFTNGSVGNGSRIYFNTDGTAFTGFFQSPPGGADHFKGDLTGYRYKKEVNGQLGQNFLDDLLILPLKRYNIYARGNYEINDWIGVFGQGIFSSVRTNTVQDPSPAVNGWSAVIPVDGRAIPADLQTLLAARPNPTAPWQLTQNLAYANRTSQVDVTTYNMIAGLQGKVPSTDWTWEVYGSRGESVTASLLKGFASLERYRAIVTAPNWGAGFKATGNATGGGFGASTATCTSGLNPFMTTAVSQDCINAITADIKTRSTMEQTVWEGTAQGSLFALPAGNVKAAVGASYRANKYTFLNDTLTTQGSSFLDQAIGLYPSGNSGGRIVTKEVYGELLVPVLSDTFVKKFDLELGARMSHYNTTGTSYTYKILGDVEVNNWIRFRGGFNRAERAPNIAELYLAPQQTFVFAAAGDPCSVNNPLPYSANPAANPNAAKVKTLCSALMNRADPGTSAKFYADPTFQTSGGTYAFPSLVGNPGLKPEKANTWTAGVVLRSPFEADALRALRLTIDYYNIKVKDAIGAQSIDIAQRQCVDPAFNPTYDVNSPFCKGVERVAGDGAIGNVQTTYFNNGRFQTSGLDIQVDWGADIGPGRFSLNSVVNYLLHLKTAELSNLPLVDYAGSLGPAQNGLNAGAFRWKMLNTFGYNIGGYGLSLQWQHLPSVKSASYPGNASLGAATTLAGAKAYDLFNLSGHVTVMKNLTVRFGVDNLFDKAPPIVEYNTAAAAGTLPGGSFNNYFYDLNGRRFFLGANVKF